MGLNRTDIEYRLPDRPETILAQHFEEATGIHVEPDALLKFMTENWRTVSFLAHRIHHNHTIRKHVERSGEIMQGGL